MLCFEVWRNDEKLVTPGVETGVLSFVLNWVGREPDTSSAAVASAGSIPGMHCSVGGIDGAGSKHVDWCETENLKIGDEFRVRLISTDAPDPPLRSKTAPRGHPNWISKRQD
jgi:hypothetical protein